MEVSGPQFPLPQAADMEMDIDIDLGPIEEMLDVPLTTDHSSFTQPTVETNDSAPKQVFNAGSDDTIPYKLYIEGVDTLTTNDLKSYAQQCFDSEVPSIQWIDDSSATFVFSSAEVASSALHHLTLSGHGNQSSTPLPPLQLRPARSLSAHADTKLQIRIARPTDKKQPRAHESSRFYLMNPEHDPREQRRRDRSYPCSDGNYRRRRYGNDEDRRRRRKDRDDGFQASMYDDNGGSSRRGSLASSPDERPRGVDSYRPNRNDTNGVQRDRSASPDRRQDHSRHRNRTPPPKYRSRDPDPFPSENKEKELFPRRKSSRTEGSDAFSNRMAAAKTKKELFPQKAQATNHRRSNAFDAADETADLFANGLAVPFTDSPTTPAKRLVHRVSAPSESSYGRLRSSDSPHENASKTQTNFMNGDLSILGAAQQDQGFSIRGGANHVGTIRELFPGKANLGKELFAEKLQGRGGKRNKAEDMFY